MLGILLLSSLPTLPTSGGVAKGLLKPPSAADINVTVPLAERGHGAHVADRAGTALGIVDSSDATMVIILVGAHKIQVPASALRKIAGQLTLPITAQQVEQTLAGAAAYQERTHPSPSPVLPPKGFPPLAPVNQSIATSVMARP